MIPVSLPLVCILPSFPYRPGTDRISAILWLQPDSCWLASNPPVYQWVPLVQGPCCQAVHADKCPPTTCILCVNTKNSTLGRKTNKGPLNLSNGSHAPSLCTHRVALRRGGRGSVAGGQNRAHTHNSLVQGCLFHSGTAWSSAWIQQRG